MFLIELMLACNTQVKNTENPVDSGLTETLVQEDAESNEEESPQSTAAQLAQR